MPGNKEWFTFERRDQAEREDMEVGHMVSVQDVKVTSQQPQAGEGEI
jgi:hypothetical protein